MQAIRYENPPAVLPLLHTHDPEAQARILAHMRPLGAVELVPWNDDWDAQEVAEIDAAAIENHPGFSEPQS